jgi:uncharacterized protein YndB with AHSA1/START domain
MTESAADTIRQIEVRARSTASPWTVFAVLADVDGWASWSGLEEAVLERAGGPAPHGLGAVNRFRAGELVARAQIIDFDPPNRLAYRGLADTPLPEYRGSVELTRVDGGGTEITWTSRYRNAGDQTGATTDRAMSAALSDLAERLARAAESDPR